MAVWIQTRAKSRCIMSVYGMRNGQIRVKTHDCLRASHLNQMHFLKINLHQIQNWGKKKKILQFWSTPIHTEAAASQQKLVTDNTLDFPQQTWHELPGINSTQQHADMMTTYCWLLRPFVSVFYFFFNVGQFRIVRRAGFVPASSHTGTWIHFDLKNKSARLPINMNGGPEEIMTGCCVFLITG